MMGGQGCIYRVPIKRRPRFANGKAYVDKATKADEAAVRAAYRGPKFQGPVQVRIFVFKPLKSVREDQWHPFIEKPDVDNVAKAVLDGLNGVAYEDDAQVTDLHVMKQDRGYEEPDATEPWCMFFVYPIEDTEGRPLHV